MMQDLALYEGLSGELALYDINHQRAAANAELGEHIFGLSGAVAPFTVKAYEDRSEALAGADFVFISILPGPMTCFGNDLDIPAKYGVVQTVGDTIGPGGLSRCLRTVPIFVDIAHAIAEHCPDAWVINYTNPMTVATQALTAVVPDLKTIGCCHEVFGTRGWVAMMAGQYFDMPVNGRNDLEIEVIGLNHFTFFPWARFQGKDAFPAVQAWIDKQGDFFGDHTEQALAREAKGRFGSCDGLIQLDFLRQFGVIGAAGDRHLVEFVPWYAKDEATLQRWGVSLTTSKHRLANWKPDNVEFVPSRPEELKKSNEEGIDLVGALCGLTSFATNVNVPNRGQISWLPEGHVVETMGQVSQDRVTPNTTGAFPLALQTRVQTIATVQQLTLDASLTCDRELALQALLADPLCSLPTDQAAAMLDELIEANREHLPEAW
jgi:alpha-galactosidase